MFSYLRPHRRTPSNPSSPVPEQLHSWEGPQHPTIDHGNHQRYQDSNPPEPPSKSSPPPILPPIARVSSTGFETTSEFNDGQPRVGQYNWDPRAQTLDAQRGNSRAQDTYTYNNHPRIPIAGQRPESVGNTGNVGGAGPSNYTSSQYTRPPTLNHELPSRPKLSDTRPPFSSAPELQNRPVETGRRPTGARLPTPPSGSNPVSTFEHIQPRTGKRLNLLNPMSLLARRRTSQAVTQLSTESLKSSRSGNTFNETFDPRIRGTVVHDFSAPRPPPRKILSTTDIHSDSTQHTSRQYPRSPNPQSGEPIDDNSGGPWSGGNHTPVFTEDFEEEQYPAAGPHVRKASDLSDLPLPKPPYAKGVPKPLDSNSTSKSNEIVEKEHQAARRISTRMPVLDIPPPVPPKPEGRPASRSISKDSILPPQQSNSSLKKGRPRNVSEILAKDGLPKHMKSTSSRFSFDMIGAAEQERLLEDRHRQKALEKKNEDADGDGQDDEFDDDFDYDNMMEDDGFEEPIPLIDDDYDEDDPNNFLEEEIPGVNTDLEKEDEGILDDNENIASFTFQQSSGTPLTPYSPGMISTPRDANGDVIGFALTKNSPYPSINMVQNYGPSPTLSSPEVSPPEDGQVHGLGLQGLGKSLTPEPLHPTQKPPSLEECGFPPASGIDDDLYFDDGIIDELGDGGDATEFDESVFDNIDTDEYGRPLKTFSSLPTLYSPPNLTADPSPSFGKIAEGDEQSSKFVEINEDDISPRNVQQSEGLAPQASVMGKAFSNSSVPMPGLTQDTLAAYQEALAAAAFSAAANGKFRRDSTPPNPTPSDGEDAQPDLVPDSSHTSRYEPFSPSYEDDFDYDDALEDDAIIAAANAEALAFDTDGFYGQEFGFYSAPAAGETEYANGGYFGPRGIEGINRSQSGRIASREPNLTPITERSEYSNRNSMMSLSMYGPPGSVTSPGLAQLAGLMSQPDYEGDMSLNALLKLRRGAWGGSQASLHSSTGSPRSAGGADENSSPIGQIPPWQQGGAVSLPMGGYGHRRANSAFSLVSEAPSGLGTGLQSETSSAPASPTLLMAMPANADQRKKDDKDEAVKKHKYSGSTESISYLKEEDPQSPTGERWVLERRRTSEIGEDLLLGREVVSGGRI